MANPPGRLLHLLLGAEEIEARVKELGQEISRDYDGQGLTCVGILKDLDQPVAGRHLLIVEDIVDTGLTLGFLVRTLGARGPASVKICTLLDRPPQRIIPLPSSYRGFEITGDFVVGYGMDYRQYYRNLPGIYLFQPDETEA